MNAAEQRQLEELVARYESRLSEQAKSLSRLLRHLEYHHQELGYHIPTEQCPILLGKVKLNGD